MKISVNGVPISFELETEENLGDVIDGLQDWLAGSSHRLEQIDVNGETLNPVDPSWHPRPLQDVQTVAITALSIYQKQVEGIETITAFLSLLARVMREGSADQTQAVLDELPYIEQGIARFLPDLAGLLSEPLSGFSADDADAKARLGRRAEELATILEHRQQELLEPEHAMMLSVSLVRELIPRLLEIPQQVQSGEERTAMDTVAHFTEAAARLLRLLPRIMEIHRHLEEALVEGEPLKQVLSSVNGMLRELEEALGNDDYVLLGDLMEYEVAPRFSAITDVIAEALEQSHDR